MKLYLKLGSEFIEIPAFQGDKGLKGDPGPQGPQGDTGALGIGIKSITKTGTSGLVDTYTITFTNNSKTTFKVTNGSSPEVKLELGNSTTAVISQAALTKLLNACVLFGASENLNDEIADLYARYLNASSDGGYYFYNSDEEVDLYLTVDNYGDKLVLNIIDELYGNGVVISGVKEPESDDEVANKAYVDAHSGGKSDVFIITDDDTDVEYDDTKGVAPYSTSYGYTNITINKEGFKLIEGGLYFINGDTKLVAPSANRNVRIRVGEDGDWLPVMGTTAILAGNSYFIKSLFRGYVYSTKYVATGAFHLLTDSNTTYTYLVNTLIASTIKIDDSGYGAKFSLMFPTTPLISSGRLETYSSLVNTTASGTGKNIVTPTSGKFYIDRTPLYVYTANETAGSANVNAVYQKYNLFDARYTANTSSTYMTTYSKAFLYLHNFNPDDYTFEANKTIGNIVTIDKLATRFPNTTEGSVYLYFLGWTSSNWYTVQTNLSHPLIIFKYTPSTGELVDLLKDYVDSHSANIEYATETEIDNIFTE